MTAESQEPIRRTAIVATTHPVRGVIVAKSALEQMAEQINEHGLPSYFEHDPTQPPIGRAYAAQLRQLCGSSRTASGRWLWTSSSTTPDTAR